MDLRWCGSVALLAILGIAALFLFPLAHGSYSATHGPTTTLRWKQLRAVLMYVMAAGASLLAQLFAPLLLRLFPANLEAAALCPALASPSPLRR